MPPLPLLTHKYGIVGGDEPGMNKSSHCPKLVTVLPPTRRTVIRMRRERFGGRAVSQTGDMNLSGDLRRVRGRRISDWHIAQWATMQLPLKSMNLFSLPMGVVATLFFSSKSYAQGNAFKAQASGFDDISGAISRMGALLVDAASAFHARAPALALGMLCVALLLPLALLTFGVRSVVAARRYASAMEEDGASERTALVTGFSRPRRACLEGSDLGDVGSFEIRRALTRIGRADDNEVVINNADLEAYHAAIERTPECDIYLCDLTRGARRAARVNGKRAPRLRLCDGDVITLGRVTLTYRTSAL